MSLAHDLPTAWNAAGADARTKQRITHILIREVIIDLDDATAAPKAWMAQGQAVRVHNFHIQ